MGAGAAAGPVHEETLQSVITRAGNPGTDWKCTVIAILLQVVNETHQQQVRLRIQLCGIYRHFVLEDECQTFRLNP